jgi:mono/diheme cytochrome c family protein
LNKLPHQTHAGFWRNWIAHGKSDSLMPAFAVEEGGILSREQIESLVSYLSVAIPSKPGLPPAPKPTASLK